MMPFSIKYYEDKKRVYEAKWREARMGDMRMPSEIWTENVYGMGHLEYRGLAEIIFL
jgi:hypothetical protein